ncbi:hypothetical protein [Aggregatilinea lenta]|uniref:hypothetical protein n=1 Tax=Aggregatilinea lenta TaxID=913108 RepID=UPI000E5BD640|nr:hypothetical protein [Aggregatilinea lenta]
MVSLPPNLMQGIFLVQSGRKVEALAYLRHAARTEPVGPEGWLWLAAATDDLEEYRYCVQMALQLDRAHAVARQMRDDLARRGIPVDLPPDNGAGIGVAERSLPYRGTRRRRILLAVMVLLLLAAVLGVIYVVTMTDVLSDAVDEVDQALSGTETTIRVGSAPSFRFRVDLPESWMAADEDSGGWQSTRTALEDDFPAPGEGGGVLEQVDESFSAVTRDPVYGAVQPNVRLVNTDRVALAAEGMVATLTLQEILPLPEVDAGEDPTVCNRLGVLQRRSQDDAATDGSEVIASGLIERDLPQDCVFFVHRRFPIDSFDQNVFLLDPDRAPEAMRAIAIVVPVGAERYALWWLTYADEAAEAYQDTLDGILETLEYVPDA